MSIFELNNNEKYSLIIIPNTYLETNFPSEHQVCGDIWAFRGIPFDLTSHWKKWLGTLIVEEIERANFSILSKIPSKHPETSNEEDKQNSERIQHFYWGVFITCFFSCNGTPTLLTGANYNNEIQVRSFQQLSPPFLLQGSPIDHINSSFLASATIVADAINKSCNTRLARILQSFYNGIMSPETENKLHQFVRCIEGFIYPDPGSTLRQFKSRTELFLGPQYHPLTEELYRIRCSIEHLHNPFHTIHSSTEREKKLIFVQRVIESEAIAKYCIYRVLTTPNLWQYFIDDVHIEQFWKLHNEDRCHKWGESLDLGKISETIHQNLINNKY